MSWDLAVKEKVRISLLLRPSHFTLEKSLESVWNQKKSYKVEIVTDQRLLDFSDWIVDFQQQQKAPQSSILSCIRLAENCLFSRGWILKIFVCSTNVRRICTSLLICVFHLGRAGQTCVWGFVVLLGKPALNRGKKEGRGVERPEFRFF